ncbi:MAG TPA: hypothetical protein EYH03_06770 [Chromatiales bacterium]|nr:hypothetical protein [Chromatiales bacterium]
MNISGTHFPVPGDGSNRTALKPVTPPYAVDDAPSESSSRSRPRRSVAQDMSRLERIQQQLYGSRIFLGRSLGARAHHAIMAYGSVKEFENREYLRAVMGVDEFA